MQAPPDLSIVIPAYNEAGRIGLSLERLAAFLNPRPERYEIVVVDDGSRDDTAAIVGTFGRARGEGIVRLLDNGVNHGKGYSLKHGVLLARGVFLLLTDADLSTPIEELPRLLDPVRRGACGIAIGSRALDTSRIEIRQPVWREMMGRTFNAMVRALTGLPFRDTQCGFKVMRREAVLPLFRAARVERFAYDVEILYLARRSGVAVLEMPVIWRNAPGSKVSAVSDSLDMLKDVIRLRWLHRRGALRAPGRNGGGERT
jgi:dolichyl-phosphate beta-glucosyltransferase